MSANKGRADSAVILPWLARYLDLHPWRLADEPADTANILFGMMFPSWLWEWRDDVPLRTPQELAYSPSKLFGQRGIASMRTGWEVDDMLLSHKCGPEVHGQHRQHDQNHLALYALGERFLVDEGYGREDATDEDGKPAPSRYYARADVHNVVLVDGQDPNPLLRAGGLAGGRIIDWQQMPGYDTSLGDARGAFALERSVDRALRRVLLVRDASAPFVIAIDVVAVDDSGTPYDFAVLWRTAKENRIDVRGRKFVIAGRKHDCHGEVLYAEGDVELKLKKHFGLPQLRMQQKSARLETVTVLAPARRGEKLPQFTCQRHGPGDFTITARDGKAVHVVRAGTRLEGPLLTPIPVAVRREKP